MAISAYGEERADSIVSATIQGDTIVTATADTTVIEALPQETEEPNQTAEVVKTPKKAKKAKAAESAFTPDPRRATWYSIVCPGLGQIYNRSYWKLPIIYGGVLTCTYLITWNGRMYNDYRNAYHDIIDSDPNTKSYEKMLPMGYDISNRVSQFQEIFKNKKNYYRKYRDMSIFAFVAVYAIAAIDAYVDAELSSFDISEDLSLQVVPAVISSRAEGQRHQQLSVTPEQTLGMALRLHF